MLNPELFAKLQNIWGTVGITNENEEANIDIEYPPALSGQIKARWKVPEGAFGGEWYRVQCPYCQDQHQHLNISYLSFATPSVPGYTVERAGLIANCFHGCLKGHPERVQELSTILKNAGIGECNLKVTTSESAEMWSELADTPDLCGFRTWIRDYRPMETAPDDVLQYLQSRNLDPVYLSATYKVGWGPVFSQTSQQYLNRKANHLLIPVIQNGGIRGFQARVCASKEECEQHGYLRYWTHPACKKTSVLYGIDVAEHYPFCCISEGATDAWAFKGPGVAVFGPDVARYQERLLVSRWSNGAVFYFPDTEPSPGLDPVAKAKKKCDDWNIQGLFKHGAHVVMVPTKDPGSCPYEQIVRAADEQTCCLFTRLLKGETNV